MSASRFDWERAIRDLPLRPYLMKLVAFALATYANQDGTRARPGEQRLAGDCGVTDRAVRTHLTALRNLGLIQSRSAGHGGRRGLADEYELSIPAAVAADLATFRDARRDDRRDRTEESGIALRLASARLDAWFHRNGGSGGGPRITGTPVPVDSSSTGSTEHFHRNGGSNPPEPPFRPPISRPTSSPSVAHPSAPITGHPAPGGTREAADVMDGEVTVNLLADGHHTTRESA